MGNKRRETSGRMGTKSVKGEGNGCKRSKRSEEIGIKRRKGYKNGCKKSTRCEKKKKKKRKWVGLRKLALVGIIPNQILFSFSSDKDRRTDSRIRRKNTVQPRQE